MSSANRIGQYYWKGRLVKVLQLYLASKFFLYKNLVPSLKTVSTHLLKTEINKNLGHLHLQVQSLTNCFQRPSVLQISSAHLCFYIFLASFSTSFSFSLFFLQVAAVVQLTHKQNLLFHILI